jgi:hypothetical protein
MQNHYGPTIKWDSITEEEVLLSLKTTQNWKISEAD